MAVIFSEQFGTASYTAGTNFINNFYSGADGNIGYGEVVNFGTMTGTTSSSGFFERLGQGWAFAGVLTHNEATAVSTTAVSWAGMNIVFGNPKPMLTLLNANLSSGTGTSVISGTPIIAVVVNQDNTMSMVISSTNGESPYAGGAYIATTQEQVYYHNTWQYFSFSAHFAQTIVTTGTVTSTLVACGGTLAVDGDIVLVGTGTLNISPSSLWTTGANVNQWQFIPGGWLGEMAGYTGTNIPSTLQGFFPFPASPQPNSRFTQAAVEYIQRPTIREARLTQGVAEIVQKPSQRNARFTQGVVEIIYPISNKLLWYVYEA